MKKLAVIFSIVFFVLSVHSQQGPRASVASEPKTSTKTSEEKRSKVDVPAEKLRPVTIPKISPGIMIDGKIDEEMWKTAAVFDRECV